MTDTGTEWVLGYWSLSKSLWIVHCHFITSEVSWTFGSPPRDLHTTHSLTSPYRVIPQVASTDLIWSHWNSSTYGFLFQNFFSPGLFLNCESHRVGTGFPYRLDFCQQHPKPSSWPYHSGAQYCYRYSQLNLHPTWPAIYFDICSLRTLLTADTAIYNLLCHTSWGQFFQGLTKQSQEKTHRCKSTSFFPKACSLSQHRSWGRSQEAP